MKITLTNDPLQGPPIADVHLRNYIGHHIKNGDNLYVSNELAVHVARAILFQMPVDQRPNVEWEIYGKQVTFDENLRSSDAWHFDSVNEWALGVLLENGQT